jgi:hypothetical protein
MMSQRAAIGRAVIALGVVVVIVFTAVAYSTVLPGGPAVVESMSSSTETAQTPTSSAGASLSTSRSAIQSTCTVPPSGIGNFTITVTAGQFPPCGCVLVDSNSNGSLYVSSNAKVGDNVCITASLNHSPQVNLSVENSTGSVVFSGTCITSKPQGAHSLTGVTCTA